ncbi:MAG: hypothetical protein HY875_00425 [Chloroflexi bacterium]|nr:hypothetical protein [Chloroflexota bacterium]
MKKFVVAMIVLAAMLTVIAGPGTGALFTDASTGSGNAFSTDTLAPPTAPSATLGSDGETVTLTWTATASTWATSYDLYYGTTSGSYPTFVKNIAGRTTVTTTDVPASGSAAHYALQARFQNWASLFSTPDVTVKPLDHFIVKASDGTSNIANQTAGTSFTVKATAQAADNSTVTVFTGNVTLASNLGAITCSPSCTQAAVAGVATFNVTYAAAVTATSLTATGGSPNAKTGTSNTFDVASASVPSLYFSDSTTMETLPDTGSFTITPAASATLMSSPAATTATSVKTVQSGTTGWTLNLVLKNNTPNAANAKANVTIWWQNGSCTPGAIPATQILAQATGTGAIAIAKPGSNDKYGETFTIPSVGSVSRTMVSGDVVCLNIEVLSNSQDAVTIYTNTASLTGVTGLISGIIGPMTFN